MLRHTEDLLQLEARVESFASNGATKLGIWMAFQHLVPWFKRTLLGMCWETKGESPFCGSPLTRSPKLQPVFCRSSLCREARGLQVLCKSCRNQQDYLMSKDFRRCFSATSARQINARIIYVQCGKRVMVRMVAKIIIKNAETVLYRDFMIRLPRQRCFCHNLAKTAATAMP